MNRWRTIRVVAGREVQQRMRSRSFAIATAVLLVSVLAAVIIPSLIPDRHPTYDVGIVGGTSSLRRAVVALEPTVGGTLHVREVRDVATGRAALRDGALDLVVDPKAGEMLVRERPESDSGLARVVSAVQFVAGLDRAGIDPGRAANAVSSGYQLRALEASTKDKDAKRGVAFAAVILLFLVLLTYGQWIASGVIEEKSSRIVEILLPAVRADELLTGKVLGISAVALTQFGTVAIAALIGSLAVGNDLPDTTSWIIVTSIVCFVAGYAFYAAVFAAAGSLVSRVEDVGSAVVPITSVLTAVYLASLFAEPDSALVKVLSFLPVSMAMAMPPRVAIGDAAWWEVVLSVVITFVAAAFAMVAAGRLYRGGLLRRGPKLKWRDAWRASA